MIECVVCGKEDCPIIHTYEEIRATSDNCCYVCQQPNCIIKHTLEELKNPIAPSPEQVRKALRICMAYDKLLKHGDDQASTE